MTTRTPETMQDVEAVQIKDAGADPSTPDTDHLKVYPKNGALYFIDENDTVIAVMDLATAGQIAGLTEKASPVAADTLILNDSAASDAVKYAEVGNLPFLEEDEQYLSTVADVEVSNTTDTTAMATVIVGGGALGTKGMARIRATFQVSNNKGTSGTATFRAVFGSTILYSKAITCNNHATNRWVVELDVALRAASASGAQRSTIAFAYTAADGGAAGNDLTEDARIHTWKNATEDTTGGQVFKIDVTLSAADTSFACHLVDATIIGPIAKS